MSHHHHLAGLPEWADDLTAEETVEALGLSLNPSPSPRDEEERADFPRRQGWRLAAAFYWATAHLALTEQNWPAMRQAATQARDCETKANPLLNAVFGSSSFAPDNLVAQGARLTPQQVVDHQRAVSLAIIRHDRADHQRAQRQRLAQQQTQALVDQQHDQAVALRAQHALSIGETYIASVPYKLAKKSVGLCSINGVRVIIVPGPSGGRVQIADGDLVQITAFSHGKLFGLHYEAAGIRL